MDTSTIRRHVSNLGFSFEGEYDVSPTLGPGRSCILHGTRITNDKPFSVRVYTAVRRGAGTMIRNAYLVNPGTGEVVKEVVGYHGFVR